MTDPKAAVYELTIEACMRFSPDGNRMPLSLRSAREQKNKNKAAGSRKGQGCAAMKKSLVIRSLGFLCLLRHRSA
ncbi:hypothetical protein [Paenibacillus sp. NEAU-GSW1]|uniref:hypothetical protein n=1 Tax=Paenibacillus sp. NEAU-GSW1 TaxID=2682486 RepID=UPI0012E1AD8F|nr:hypothetical protein [Paenibacillus sp. NEAU-GSW1]MUT66215.1 hypothetical protein [Paenibacillus sp. NEAU-GSW1]